METGEERSRRLARDRQRRRRASMPSSSRAEERRRDRERKARDRERERKAREWLARRLREEAEAADSHVGTAAMSDLALPFHRSLYERGRRDALRSAAAALKKAESKAQGLDW